MNTSDTYFENIAKIIENNDCKEILNKDCVKILCSQFITDIKEVIDNDVLNENWLIIKSFTKRWESALTTAIKSIKNKDDYFIPNFVKRCVVLYVDKMFSYSSTKAIRFDRVAKFEQDTTWNFENTLMDKRKEGEKIFVEVLKTIHICHWQELFYHKYKYDGCYIYANDGTQIALQITDEFNVWMDKKDNNRILSDICQCLYNNAESPFNKNLTLKIDFSEIMIYMKDGDLMIPILEVSGWGHISSSVDYDEDVAVKIQDNYAKWIFNTLNK